MGLKLKAGLAELDAATAVSGAVRSSGLSSLERDLLKDAMAVVKRFKAIVRNRFHLEGA
jgi:CBS domain-containing protein